MFWIFVCLFVLGNFCFVVVENRKWEFKREVSFSLFSISEAHRRRRWKLFFLFFLPFLTTTCQEGSEEFFKMKIFSSLDPVVPSPMFSFYFLCIFNHFYCFIIIMYLGVEQIWLVFFGFRRCLDLSFAHYISFLPPLFIIVFI